MRDRLYLLRRLGALLPAAVQLVGIDPAPSMIEVARAESADERLSFSVGVAEHLPFLDQTFDLVVSTTSFDHWSDQQSGLSECARVMTPGGGLVLTDQFSGGSCRRSLRAAGERHARRSGRHTS